MTTLPCLGSAMARLTDSADGPKDGRQVFNESRVDLAQILVASADSCPIVKVDRADRLPQAAEDIRRPLRQRHHLAQEAEDDVDVRDLAEAQASREAASGVLTFWLSVVASVSLIVCGISITNIMPVSVTGFDPHR